PLPPRSTARTPASGAGYRGSNPWGAAKLFYFTGAFTALLGRTVDHLFKGRVRNGGCTDYARMAAALPSSPQFMSVARTCAPFTRAYGTANSFSQPLGTMLSRSDTSRNSLSGALLTASAATSHISRNAPS